MQRLTATLAQSAMSPRREWHDRHRFAMARLCRQASSMSLIINGALERWERHHSADSGVEMGSSSRRYGDDRRFVSLQRSTPTCPVSSIDIL